MKILLFCISFALVFLGTQNQSLAAEKIKIVMLGDSLTEGLGVATESAYPHLVEEILNEKGREVTVVNARLRSIKPFLASTR